jgi:hypothetical protein
MFLQSAEAGPQGASIVYSTRAHQQYYCILTYHMQDDQFSMVIWIYEQFGTPSKSRFIQVELICMTNQM